ncbi:uncharacterized protein LOC119167172 [Rhipicephalus microplus]|uniref:uncharacterized protein LOC119167172 n=1 Tax=Rhipicephalus microplus TaxID=6941 RepID=UPI003F6C0591
MNISRCLLVIILSVTNVYGLSEKGKWTFRQPAVCTKPPDRGPCRANVTYWYFQERYRECKLFNYGGCGGNGNRFWSEKKCYKRCAAPGKGKLLCSVNPEPKPCKSTFQAWYFDPRDNACHRLPRGMCTDTINRFMFCEKCMKRCSAENAREACKREYKRIREEENSIKQGQSPALVAPEGASAGTPQGQPAAGAGLLVPKPPLQGGTGGQQENSLGPVTQAPNLPQLQLPAPAPGLAGNAGQLRISEQETGEVISGTSAGKGTGRHVTVLPPTVQQTAGNGGALPRDPDVLSPTVAGLGPVSVTNRLEGGGHKHVILVAIVKPTNEDHDTAGLETNKIK